MIALAAKIAFAQHDEGPQEVYFPQTSHYLKHGFLDYWHHNGELKIFGYPISEEFTENGLTVQYFERARFEWHGDKIGTPFVDQLGLLGSSVANKDKVNVSPLQRSLDTANYDPNLWYVPLPPNADDLRSPLAGAPADQAKWIEVDLSDQYLRAWEYSRTVYGAYFSTSVPAHPTPSGMFHIIAKYQSRDLTGETASAVDLTLPNVPHVMYFFDDMALTGTYWHSAFGTPMTTGSVNLPLQSAEWIVNWAAYETVVWIHE